MNDVGFLIFLIIAVVALFTGLGFLIYRNIRGYRRGEIPLFIILIVTVFVAAFCIFFPIYWGQFVQDYTHVLKTILLSIHNAIRLFIVDCDFEMIFSSTETLDPVLKSFYHGVAAVIFVSAPILTFGFVLSFFKNTVSIIKFKSPFRKEYYIFSELNEKSIVLAEDIRAKRKNATIVFTDVHDEDNDEINEIVDRAKAIFSINFKKDVTSLNLSKSNKKTISVFLMSEDDNENIEAYSALYKTYKDRENLSLYLFSKSPSSSMTFNRPGDIETRKAHAFRIDTDSFLVSNYLWKDGKEIFQSAYKDEESGQKIISIAIVGLGRYGKVLLKNLVWYCQMEGYYLKINAFDAASDATERFTLECPELMDPKLNGKVIEGEAQYEIHIHDGVYVGSKEYKDKIEAINDITYIFVSLGSDDMNIQTALDLRTLMAGLKRYPLIKTYRPDCDKEATFETATNYKGQPYDISFIGDYRSSYSYDTVIDNEFQKAGLEVNRGYGGDDAGFWFHEYNYRSSCATAIHNKAKVECGIDLNRKASDISEEELYRLAVLEHRRWNAWMRSEGYSWSGSYDRSSRNDLAKLHHNLVPFGKLNDEDKYKDIKVILSIHE